MDPRVRYGLILAVIFAFMFAYSRYESQRTINRWQHPVSPDTTKIAQPAILTNDPNASGAMQQTIERLSVDVNDLKTGFADDKLLRLVQDVQALQAIAQGKLRPAVTTPP